MERLSFTKNLYNRKQNRLRAMTTVQVQVRAQKRVVQELDRWISEGRFANRSEAIKTVLALYEEREKTREFYKMLLQAK
jgi:Arc/MetJ-type ribon-helix-helix transcriptional regulator